MLFPSSGSSPNYTDIVIRDNSLSGLQDRPPNVTYNGSAIFIRGGEQIAKQEGGGMLIGCLISGNILTGNIEIGPNSLHSNIENDLLDLRE